MRITEKDREMIRQVTSELTEGNGVTYVFGSRLVDQAKGGDLDLLVRMDVPVEKPAWLASQLSANISRNLYGRKEDLVLSAPNLKSLPIHSVALRDGVLV